MNQFIFNIENLKCAYDGLNPVLEVSSLNIPRGKLVVLLGKSGAGKSTFLETLGLMNNTIIAGEVNFFPDLNSTIPTSFNQLWLNRNNGSQANVRAEHMSFIFQNTNLMPDYGALDNIVMAHLIKGNTPEKAKDNALKIMQSLNIKDLADNKDVVKLSGGQRQRIAFVRAISTPFSVIFGDEPTGNLDQFNSNDLMSLLRSTIIEKNATAIIVTHNIELAINFADMIVLIAKKNGQNSGMILPENVLTKATAHAESAVWSTGNGQTCLNPIGFIHELIN
jgi:lipoprotein-releasing system ATP-binding protein